MMDFKNVFIFIQKNIKDIFFLSISFCWISLFIWFRFIMKKSGYNLVELKINYSFFFLTTSISFICLHIFLLLFALYSIFYKEKNKYKPTIFQIIQKFIDFMIIQPFETLRKIIAPHIPYSGIIFVKITQFFEKHDLSLLKYPVIFFSIIPRILVSVVFYIEIVFFNKIHYFITCILLLLIPLFWNIFVNLYTNFAERALQDIPKYIHVIPVGDPEPNGWHSSYNFKLFDKYIYQENDLKEYSEGFMNAISMYGFGKTLFKGFLAKVSPYVTLFTSSLYLFASIYKLIFLMF